MVTTCLNDQVAPLLQRACPDCEATNTLMLVHHEIRGAGRDWIDISCRECQLLERYVSMHHVIKNTWKLVRSEHLNVTFFQRRRYLEGDDQLIDPITRRAYLKGSSP